MRARHLHSKRRLHLIPRREIRARLRFGRPHTLRLGSAHISDHSLRALIDMDVLHPDVLVTIGLPNLIRAARNGPVSNRGASGRRKPNAGLLRARLVEVAAPPMLRCAVRRRSVTAQGCLEG
jgi:hypothetical protein